jgi:sugar lactone lactonase YvrE
MSGTKIISANLLAEGEMVFGEGPRWHEGKLYLSDMLGRKIYKIDDKGHKQVLLEVENQPNGLGFMDDGSLIYTSMFDKKLYRYLNGKSELYADMSAVMKGYCGDLVIDKQGRVYVDDTGARVLHGESPGPGRLLMVDTDRSVKVAAENIIFPNGVVITGDGKNLIISETFAYCLTQFDVSDNGELLNRRKFLDLAEQKQNLLFSGCDGMCMDAEGGIWLSRLALEVFERIDRNGNVTHRIPVKGHHPTACTLGGEDGKTLYLVANEIPDGADVFEAMMKGHSTCRVLTATVDIPRGAARP